MFYFSCAPSLWIDDTSARNVINPLAPWSLLTSFETKIIMVYIITTRGKGLIHEDSCNLCKERGMEAARTKGFVAKICFARHSSRFPKILHISVRASLCIWFVERRDAFLVSRISRASYARINVSWDIYYFLVARKPRPSLASILFLRHILRVTREILCTLAMIDGERTRPSTRNVNGDVNVDEFSRLRTRDGRYFTLFLRLRRVNVT